MQVVYTPAHLAHDITTETFMGLSDPRERGRRAGRADPRRADGRRRVRVRRRRPSTARRRSPPSTIRVSSASSRSPGPRSAGRASSRPFLSADTYPNRSMFEGMSDDAVAALVREPVHAGGRAGFWGLDSAAPLVAGTYVAARGAVDVALTTADLVLAGAPAAYGLCRPPGHHAARSMYGGYCFFNNAAIAAEAIVRATGERVAILDVDYHHGNGSQQIFWRRGDVRYVSIHADPDSDYPYFLGRADETGEGDGAGENLNIPLPGRDDRRGVPRRGRPGARGDRRDARVDRRRLARLRHLRARPDRHVRADDRRLPRDRPADGGARSPPGHPPGGRLPPAVARRERPGLAARRRGSPVRPAAGGRVRGAAALSRGSADRRRRTWRLAVAAELAARDADLAAIVERFGLPPLWDRRPGFATLLHIILEQQVSLSSAQAAFDRLRAAGGPADAGAVPGADRRRAARDRLQPPEGALRPGAGGRGRERDARSRRRSSRWTTPPSTTRSRRCPGIGPWTSTIYLLMVLGRPDVWPVGDIALATSVGEVKGLGRRPDAAEMEVLGEAWRPFRSVAARLFWLDYLGRRGRTG